MVPGTGQPQHHSGGLTFVLTTARLLLRSRYNMSTRFHSFVLHGAEGDGKQVKTGTSMHRVVSTTAVSHASNMALVSAWKESRVMRVIHPRSCGISEHGSSFSAERACMRNSRTRSTSGSRVSTSWKSSSAPLTDAAYWVSFVVSIECIL